MTSNAIYKARIHVNLQQANVSALTAIQEISVKMLTIVVRKSAMQKIANALTTPLPIKQNASVILAFPVNFAKLKTSVAMLIVLKGLLVKLKLVNVFARRIT